MGNDRDAALRRNGLLDRSASHPRMLIWAMATLVSGLSGCGAVKQDVHRYYRQMAQNYQEAEDKAKFEAATLEADSGHALRAGNIPRYNHARKELARLRSWEARCAAQRERFDRAARKLEPGLAREGAPTSDPEIAPAAGSTHTPPGG